MPTRYVYNKKREARGAQRPEGERFILYTYRIKHVLCNLCHRGIPSEVLHLYKLLLHEVRKLIFCSNVGSVLTVLLAGTLYNIKCVAALLIHPHKVTQIYNIFIHNTHQLSIHSSVYDVFHTLK